MTYSNVTKKIQKLRGDLLTGFSSTERAAVAYHEPHGPEEDGRTTRGILKYELLNLKHEIETHWLANGETLSDADKLVVEIRAGDYDEGLLDYRQYNSPDQWLPERLYEATVENTIGEPDWNRVMDAAMERAREIHGDQ